METEEGKGSDISECFSFCDDEHDVLVTHGDEETRVLPTERSQKAVRPLRYERPCFLCAPRLTAVFPVRPGDVIVYINDVCVLGTTHADVVKLFQSVPIGQSVTLVLCRGYALPFDPEEAANANNTTTTIISPLGIMEQRPVMANGRSGYDNYLDYLSRAARYAADPGQDAAQQLLAPHPGDTHLDGSLPPGAAGATPPDSVSVASSGAAQGELLTLTMVKGAEGFGFTIADSAAGQRVKQVLEPQGCPGLSEGDLVVEVNKRHAQGLAHTQVVELLKDCAVGTETILVVQRGGAGRGGVHTDDPEAEATPTTGEELG
ncbi:Membrane-associated guanylate kinase, WW and PDZ domain-containing protein 2 [Liparis tanakae]|uniref:Membrane-associated guanylate kinase, WW and PDZ domain-containing protein 2 n=1 Tax=Liparis tanakae TaxID=230148 RepID=A0A4Z2FY09_9TELE|nr:Membrane-associated guanylate kinase, WW and PDZ domain-containing protein 2 [Liparis tanakae]